MTKIPKIPGLCYYFFAGISGIFPQNPAPKCLRPLLVVVSAWRRWRRRRAYYGGVRAHGGVGGAVRWRRVVAVGTLTDAPGLPGDLALARSPAAARAA